MGIGRGFPLKRALTLALFLLPILLLMRSTSPKEAGLFLLATALHEIGHLAAIFLFGFSMRDLTFSPTGISIELDTALIPYRKEAWIHLAGPCANLLAMAMTLILIRRRMSALLLYFFFCNLLLCSLNLLPAEGLDGHRALRAMLCQSREEARADAILRPVDLIFTAVLFAGGTALFLMEKNASLLLLSLSLLSERITKKATIQS